MRFCTYLLKKYRYKYNVQKKKKLLIFVSIIPHEYKEYPFTSSNQGSKVQLYFKECDMSKVINHFSKSSLTTISSTNLCKSCNLIMIAYCFCKSKSSHICH